MVDFRRRSEKQGKAVMSRKKTKKRTKKEKKEFKKITKKTPLRSEEDHKDSSNCE